MEVEYQNSTIEKVCTKAYFAEKKYGRVTAEKIHLRIDQIRAADSVEEMIQNHIGRCHPLHNNREGQYAVDLDQPRRLIFTKRGNDIQIVNIIEVVDYH